MRARILAFDELDEETDTYTLTITMDLADVVRLDLADGDEVEVRRVETVAETV